MFLEHFELNEQPFGMTTDPRFLYLGTKHRAAHHMLASAAQADRSVLMLTAEPGMGKTFLLFHYIQSLRDDSKTAFLFQTAGNSVDLSRYLLADLGLKTDGDDISKMDEAINRALSTLRKQGLRFVLVIDDGHNLHPQGFQSPLFAAYDQPWMNLIQIVIAGRPQLAEHLAHPSLAAFRKGISTCIRLTGFSPEETRDYMDYRLRAAGHSGSRLFTPDAQLLIAMQSGGVPRHINSLCFNSMWMAYRLGAKLVDSTIVREVVTDLVIDAKNLEGKQSSVLNRIFAPLASSAKLEPEPAPSSWIGRLTYSMSVLIFAMLFLVVVPGVDRSTGTYSPPADGQPTASSTVAPAAPSPSFAPPPVTMTNKITKANVSPGPMQQARVVQVAAGSNDDIVPRLAASASTASQIVTVVVEPHVTLRHLSLQYLGRFDPATLVEIERLNPFLVDPGHIEVNAKIRLPLYMRRVARRQAIDVADATRLKSGQEKP